MFYGRDLAVSPEKREKFLDCSQNWEIGQDDGARWIAFLVLARNRKPRSQHLLRRDAATPCIIVRPELQNSSEVIFGIVAHRLVNSVRDDFSE